MKTNSSIVSAVCFGLSIFGCTDTSTIHVDGTNPYEEQDEQQDPSCKDACDRDLCDGQNAIYKCGDMDGDGCKELNTVSEPCEEGLLCVSGACVSPDSTCENACDGEPQCDGDKLKVCKVGEDGCKVWVTEDCPDEMTCSNGVCKNSIPGCEDSCSEPAACEGENSYRLCLDTDGDGCNEWSDVMECADGQTCSTGVCSNSELNCESSCSGDPECEDSTSFRACVDTDGDGCYEWSVTPCTDGLTCSNGECTKACTDVCTPDSKECDGTTGFKICTDTNGDGCYEWSKVTKCADGSTCSKGECKKTSPTCTNACTSGIKQCDGTTGFKTCTDTNGDGCTEWSAVTKCSSGMTCSDGQCKKTCTNACTSGAKQCDGTTGYKTCGDSNGDGCTEWSAVTKCSSGKTCSGGTCSTPACKYTKADDPGIHPMPSESKAGTSESVAANGFTDEYLYDASNYIKIGARREWGGSIVFFGLSANAGSNTIDGNDTGREVQVAIYDSSRIHQGCAYNASCQSAAMTCPNSITYLGWNPVQGGNRCNKGSGVKSVNNKNVIMEIVTVPLHWNPNWDATDCTSNGCSTSLATRQSDVQLTQRLRFVSTHVVELFYSIQNLANLNHTATVQELPTMYAAYGAHGLGNYNRLMNADKTEIKIDQNGNDGFFYKHFNSSAPWVTLQNANLDYGVGILYENGLLSYTGWQKAGVFNNVRSDITFGLPANGTVNARAYLILGSFDMVKNQAEWLMKTIPPFGVIDYPAENASVSGKSVKVSGWALDNSKVTKVEALMDESTTIKLNYGDDRPDVCKVWVGYPMCNHVGYSGTIDVSGLDKNCKHLLEIVATDDHGNKRTIARRLLTVQ